MEKPALRGPTSKEGQEGGEGRGNLLPLNFLSGYATDCCHCMSCIVTTAAKSSYCEKSLQLASTILLIIRVLCKHV